MIKIGVADYGLNCWDGALYDYSDRMAMLKSLGFSGIERLEARTEAEVVETAAAARRLGMGFATCRGGTAAETIKWSSALGYDYIWAESKSGELPVFCEQTRIQAEAAAEYGLKVSVHNHLGLAVESSEQLEEFLRQCPQCGLILDVGHLHAAGGDPLYIIDKYADRISAVHIKDYVIKDPNGQYWWDRIRFCELSAGEMGGLNTEILKSLKNVGYCGWIFVEHDTHLRNPAEDLAVSMKFIEKAGVL